MHIQNSTSSDQITENFRQCRRSENLGITNTTELGVDVRLEPSGSTGFDALVKEESMDAEEPIRSNLSRFDCSSAIALQGK